MINTNTIQNITDIEGFIIDTRFSNADYTGDFELIKEVNDTSNVVSNGLCIHCNFNNKSVKTIQLLRGNSHLNSFEKMKSDLKKYPVIAKVENMKKEEIIKKINNNINN